MNTSKIRFLYRAWMHYLHKDKTELAFIRHTVSKGSTVIDIGAYKGAYLYWLRKSVGDAGKVFAFEPQPTLAGYLKTINSKMKYRNVYVEQKGVSSENTERLFYLPKGRQGISADATFNVHTNPESGNHSIRVTVVTLDSYLFDKKILPSFIKIDTEGHELQVFLGAKRLLQACRPVLLFESEARHAGEDTVVETFEFLKRLNYTGYFIHKDRIEPLEKFSFQKHQKQDRERYWDSDDYCNNFIFKPSR